MPLRNGTRLGTYEIIAPLGRGGTGEVYRAKDLRLGREVALKVLHADVAYSPDHVARFEREARTVAGLNHPHIVTLFSVEEEEGIRFLTMELVEGQSLSNLITPGGLPLARILDLLIPLTDALAAAHERGVVHRDLKPANVMVNRKGRVKVLDFGLAKITAGEEPVPGARRTATAEAPISGQGQMLGTVPYMAPEQLRGERVDARADLFALGIIIYELAAGRRPFTGDTFVDVVSSILRDPPPPLTVLRADLPADLVSLVDRCLQKDPRERVQTALEVMNELRAMRRSLEHAAPAPPHSPDVVSIAVLPFVNRSRDEEDEYFSDGLADELLTVLAKIRGLRVAARTSSFHFKGAVHTIAEIGKALNVATVLEGSVRKSGSRVRISVQLVKVSDGFHIWSESYDRTLEDIFAVQDEIAHSVVKELRRTLLGEEVDSKASGEMRAEVARAAKGRGESVEAHRLYLLARYLIDRATSENVAKGIDYLEQALQLEPQFALAWAELGVAYARQGDCSWAPVAEAYGQARDAAERALSLEPDLAEGHELLGWIRGGYDWDWRGAEASFRRALELAPGNARVIRGTGVLAVYLGRVEEGIELCRQAMEQDPFSTASYLDLGLALRAGGRTADAESVCRQVLDLFPDRVVARSLLALSLLAQGRGEDALTEAAKEPSECFRLWALAMIHHTVGRRAESDAALSEMTAKCGEHSAFQIAEVHGFREEVDAAFDWLERACEQRDGGLAELKMSPCLRSLHDDPRWAALLRKVGFED